MKLSKRINLIILPVLIAIFTIAGFVAYLSQKSIVLQALQDKLQYQTGQIIDNLNTELIETDSLLKQFLNSVEVANYLTQERSSYQSYSAEGYLTRFISSVNKSTGKSIQLRITNSSGELLFYFDSTDPFSEADESSLLAAHLNFIDRQLSSDYSSIIETTSYSIEKIKGDLYQLNVFKSFSPEKSIYDTSYSKDSRLFTSVMSLHFNLSERFLPNILANFTDRSKLELNTKLNVSTLNRLEAISYSQPDSLATSAENGLVRATIKVSETYIDTLLNPYKIAIFSLVINVTLVCFYLLRLLIQKQIILPIEHLTQQVEKAIDGDEQALKRVPHDDEVSSLNNNYIKLLEDLNYLAKRDPLTGLANRSVFSAALVRNIQDAMNNSTLCALFFIDLDNFKEVNDTYGHYMGDRLLVEFSQQLSQCFRKEDLIVRPNTYSDVARIAGDEFAVILPHPPNIDIISKVAQRIVDICKDGLWVDGRHLEVNLSVGVAVSPNDATDADTLMRYADTAMYQIKRSGKNGFHFYSESLEEEIYFHASIEQAIRNALRDDNFYLNFMPIYDSQTLEVIGIEALIRAKESLLKEVGPDQFIPIAESTGLIRCIDEWVLNKSLECLRELIDKQQYSGKMSINFSSWQLKNDNFASKVDELLDFHKIPPQQVELEITETCLIADDNKTIDRLGKLKGLGISLSLDDFGTGYTAFSQLQHYPVDCLKIDRSFIYRLSESTTKHRPLVDIILELASLYQLTTVAEGVETEEQFQYVKRLGCDQVQGYYFSKPLGWKELTNLLDNQKRNRGPQKTES
ncbi:putative bifunctional diguanylate cyclase/phosphodiesterase [Vibrio diazotrophicus]|uniref:Diguanylate cyclase/phosphodiesterase n=1 Tax=Vibrio diazotrophicus TaxID=685 RepID=A0ABX4W8Z0_VIBDI|nr:GGDEF domain-containing phosphodiesterase [Vibrio diazotrophicus]PNI00241.1 hypothetical protein C1O25_12800 [Vibrio diazotrophicus]